MRKDKKMPLGESFKEKAIIGILVAIVVMAFGVVFCVIAFAAVYPTEGEDAAAKNIIFDIMLTLGTQFVSIGAIALIFEVIQVKKKFNDMEKNYNNKINQHKAIAMELMSKGGNAASRCGLIAYGARWINGWETPLLNGSYKVVTIICKLGMNIRLYDVDALSVFAKSNTLNVYLPDYNNEEYLRILSSTGAIGRTEIEAAVNAFRNMGARVAFYDKVPTMQYVIMTDVPLLVSDKNEIKVGRCIVSPYLYNNEGNGITFEFDMLLNRDVFDQCLNDIKGIIANS